MRGVFDVRPTALTSLILKMSGSLLAETVDQSLRAAGTRVTTANSPCRLLAETVRADLPFRYILLGVDWFSHDEFRLFPLLRREWPETVLVAYHSPGFGYKGELAELVGADVVLGDAHDLSHFLESLAPLAGAVRPPSPQALEVEAEAYLAQPATERQGPPKPAPRAPASEPSVEPAADRPDSTRLTAEEIRLLLGEEDET